MSRVTRRIQRKGLYPVSTHLAAVVLLVIIFVTAGTVMLVGLPGIGDERQGLLAELATNRAAWTAKRPAAFRYVVQRSCRCPPEDTARFIVTERPGSRSAEFPVPVESAGGEFLASPPRPLWLGELFPLIEEAARGDKQITVEYDAAWGYPRLVRIDGGDSDAPGGKAALTVTIRDFEILRDP